MLRCYVTDDVITRQLSNEDRRPVVFAADQQRRSADSTSWPADISPALFINAGGEGRVSGGDERGESAGAGSTPPDPGTRPPELARLSSSQFSRDAERVYFWDGARGFPGSDGRLF